MNKYKGKVMKKEEKITLLIGLLIVAIIIGLGLLTDKKDDADYVSKLEETEKEDELKLPMVSDSFKVVQGSEISINPLDYFVVSENEASNIVMDISKVDKSIPGEYIIYAEYLGKTIEIPIIIIQRDDVVPEITLEHDFVVVTIGDARIEEIITFANAKATDNIDGDITSSITGWPTEVFDFESTHRYQLRVRDSSGNEASKELIVQYQ